MLFAGFPIASPLSRWDFEVLSSQHLGSSILILLGFYCSVFHIYRCDILAVLLCMCLMYVCAKEESMCKGTRIHPCRHILEDEYVTAKSTLFLRQKFPKAWEMLLGQTKAELQEQRFY